MHLCPECSAICACDGTVRFQNDFDECTHYLTTECELASESPTLSGWLCRCGHFQEEDFDPDRCVHCSKCGAVSVLRGVCVCSDQDDDEAEEWWHAHELGGEA